MQVISVHTGTTDYNTITSRSYNLHSSASSLFIISCSLFQQYKCFFSEVVRFWSNERRRGYIFFLKNKKKQDRRGDLAVSGAAVIKSYVFPFYHLTLTYTYKQTHAHPIWLNPTNMDWWECPWTTRLIELSSLWQDREVWREWWGQN